MNSFDIFVDSGANIPDNLIKKHNIGVIPYSCTVNGEERLCYEKDFAFVDTAKKYYEDLRNGADIKTSLIGMDRVMQYLTPSLEAGKDVMLFTISSGISGTYNQAVNAKKNLKRNIQTAKFTFATAPTPQWERECSPSELQTSAIWGKALNRARNGLPATHIR